MSTETRICSECGFPLGSLNRENCKTCDMYVSDMEGRLEDRDLVEEQGPS
jgi:hypothetical protein